MVPWLVALLAMASGATTAPEDTPAERPVYLSLRYDENWGVLRHPTIRTDPFDRVKYLPIGGHEDRYVSIGGEGRLRFERYKNPGFGSEPNDPNGYLLQRYLLHAELHWAQHLRLFSQLQSGLENGRAGGPRPTDKDILDLHQVFVDLSLGDPDHRSITLRLGRQEMELGSSRLVSAREILNVRQGFDGARLLVATGRRRYAAFFLRPASTRPGQFDDRTDRSRSLWGATFVNSRTARRAGNIVVFYMGLSNALARFDQGVAPERRHTLGARVWGRKGHWDHNVEATLQRGRFGSRSIDAWSIATDNGLWFPVAPLQPRIGLRADATSGDIDPKDVKLETFNPLFAGSAYSGLGGFIGPSNAMDVSPSVSLRIPRQIAVTGGVSLFWRTSRADGIYGTSLNLLRSGEKSRARAIGDQATVQLSWSRDVHLTFSATYSHFFAGPFLADAPPGRDVDYVTGFATFRF